MSVKKSSYQDVSVRCPFYRWQKDYEIACEGFSEVSTVSLHFFDRRQKRKYVCKFCEQNYEDCILYKEVDKKYDET